MTARARSLRHLPSHGLDLSFLHLQYQPQICVRTGAVLAAEVLLRYDDPRYGRISTGEVLRVAEQSGALGAVTQEVLDLAVRDLAAWRRLQPDISMRVAVTLSRAQLAGPSLPTMVASTLDQWSVPATSMELEVEASVVACPAAPAATLASLRELGLRLVIDAFGVGQVSDALLRRLPVDAVKLDKALVDMIEEGSDHGAAVVASLRRAQRYGWESVAEGVETLDQFAFLERHGCDRVQGYLMSRPLPMEAMARFVRRRHDQSAHHDDEPIRPQSDH